MPEEINDANDFDKQFETGYSELEKVTPADSSPENKPEDDKTQDSTSGAEPVKTEQVKAVEDDASLSVEEKIARIKEIIGNDEKALDAYIKQKGYHNDPAWQKQRELIDNLKKENAAKLALSEEDRLALDDFKKYRASPEYIRQTMQAQGYKQEAIDKKLVESGFEVPVKSQDDVDLVFSKLNIDTSNMDEEYKKNLVNSITDVSKVVRIILQDEFGKTLPKQLGPIQDHIKSIKQDTEGRKLTATMQEAVKAEGILDFAKDIEPVLNKFIDDNPDCLQSDVYEHFKSINHQLTIGRLKVSNKQTERDDKKSNLRQNIPISRTPAGLPKKTGDHDKDAEAFFEAVGYHE